MKTILEIKQQKNQQKVNESNQKKQMGERLKKAIKANGISQEKFAEYCDISYETLKKYINGKSFMRADTLVLIAKQLDVPFEYLLCVDDKLSDTINPLSEKIVKATNLSKDAVSSLMNMALKKSKYDEQLKCISTLLQETLILEKLVKYFNFISEKNQKKYDDKIIERYGTNIDMENILLYQFLKEIDETSKRKIQSKKEVDYL